ncbi:MAG: D-alanyl-D-alanine carboxypeptidase/D-alanyl-D-alanine-endopeptidase [Chlorobi bacterium CHB2]|nr:D-alanyl-D-alanine carboxypeptidase/D-alanyl-D-alanine-endopeptidase [Chlorobi bacterium CHB2]
MRKPLNLLLWTSILSILLGIIAAGTDAAGAKPAGLSPAAVSSSDSAKALEKLAADLKNLISLPQELQAGRVGVVVHSVTRNHGLFALNPDRALTPASTTKVVTCFTALSELGPNYQINTIIASDAKPSDGVVQGNLYVKGYGDPFLAVSDLDALVDQVTSAGIRQVTGNVVGDGTFFDNHSDRFDYSGDADEVEPVPPIHALTIERSRFTVIVSSPRTPGLPCNVQTFPRSNGIEIVNTAVSVAAPARRSGGKRGKKRKADLLMPMQPNQWQRYGDQFPIVDSEELQQRKKKSASSAATQRGKKPAAKPSSKNRGGAKQAAKGSKATTKGKTAPAASRKAPSTPPAAVTARNGINISVTSRNGKQVVTVSGTLTANRTVSNHYEMKNPATIVAGMVHDRLRLAGVAIGGTTVSGATPANAHTIATNSRPLTEVLTYVMKNSNNFLAEYTFKIIGGANGGRTETAKKSVEKIQQRMSLAKVPFQQCVVNDGSGLSRRNCLSAAALTGIMNAAHSNQKIFPTFYSLLSVAGVDGTLRRRMRGTPAANNAHGKTGTLRNVAALTGYVTTQDGELLSFAMLMNGGNVGGYRAVQDKLAVRLASFSYAEALDSAANLQAATQPNTPAESKAKR